MCEDPAILESMESVIFDEQVFSESGSEGRCKHANAKTWRVCLRDATASEGWEVKDSLMLGLRNYVSMFYVRRYCEQP